MWDNLAFFMRKKIITERSEQKKVKQSKKSGWKWFETLVLDRLNGHGLRQLFRGSIQGPHFGENTSLITPFEHNISPYK